MLALIYKSYAQNTLPVDKSVGIIHNIQAPQNVVSYS